jgi:hypothetical protein
MSYIEVNLKGLNKTTETSIKYSVQNSNRIFVPHKSACSFQEYFRLFTKYIFPYKTELNRKCSLLYVHCYCVAQLQDAAKSVQLLDYGLADRRIGGFWHPARLQSLIFPIAPRPVLGRTEQPISAGIEQSEPRGNWPSFLYWTNWTSTFTHNGL